MRKFHCLIVWQKYKQNIGSVMQSRDWKNINHHGHFRRWKRDAKSGRPTLIIFSTEMKLSELSVGRSWLFVVSGLTEIDQSLYTSVLVIRCRKCLIHVLMASYHHEDFLTKLPMYLFWKDEYQQYEGNVMFIRSRWYEPEEMSMATQWWRRKRYDSDWSWFCRFTTWSSLRITFEYKGFDLSVFFLFNGSW